MNRTERNRWRGKEEGMERGMDSEGETEGRRHEEGRKLWRDARKEEVEQEGSE